MQTARGSIWNELHRCTHGLEPSIGEVLSDPIIHAIMRRDGVTMAELRQDIEAATLSPTAPPVLPMLNVTSR